MSVELGIVNLHMDVEAAQNPCEEEYGKAQTEVPGVEQGIESVRGVCP